MRFLSVCSGIEAASVAANPLGWKAVAFSEIEPFPCALLAHHYPDTPNWGDMTKFKEWPDVSIDLLCGGTPCQSFSVAGLRKGLDDPRGNLMLTFGAIAAKYKPKWIMWENVPGVVSSNAGKDFTSFLDMLEELGYVCDIEILDAQYFGVAQRRRRVFVCGQHRNDLLSQRTDTSALTITQCLQEILQAILTVGCSRLGSAQENSESLIHSKDGAIRRMRLFGLDWESECWPMLRENLIAAFQRYQPGQKQSGAPLGELEKELTQGGQSMDSQAESLFTLTEQSLKNALDEALAVMKSFTTSTATNSITPAQIYTCSKAALLIAKLTQLLSQSSPAFWSSALSSLTAVEEFTNYARSTSSDLFGDLERVQAWLDFIEQAERTSESFLDIGIECFGEIFPLPNCLQGHPAPRRQAGQAVTGTLSARTDGGGGLGTDFDCSGGIQPVVETLCIATGQAGAEIGADMAPTLNCNHEAPYAMYQTPHTLRGEGFDASEDGTGRGTPLVPHVVGALACNTGPNGHDAGNFACNQAVDAGHVLPVAFDTTQITSAANYSNPKAGDPCHPLAAQAHVPCIAFSAKDYGGDAMSDLAPTLRAGGNAGSHANAGVMPAIAFPANLSGTQCATTEDLAPSMGATNPTAIAFQERGRSGGPNLEIGGDLAFALTAPNGGGRAQERNVLASMAVRRLTPVECEKLQGFPVGYTNVPHRGKPAADGPRYKALGNSWAVPNVRWIFQRIDLVAAIEKIQVSA